MNEFLSRLYEAAHADIQSADREANVLDADSVPEDARGISQSAFNHFVIAALEHLYHAAQQERKERA